MPQVWDGEGRFPYEACQGKSLFLTCARAWKFTHGQEPDFSVIL